MNRLVVYGLLLAALGLIVFGITELPSWFAHPLGYCSGTAVAVRDCKGYNVWSGIASDLGEVTLITAVLSSLAIWWRKHNCHVERCPRLQWHVSDAHGGHPVCRFHHPHNPSGAGDHTHCVFSHGLAARTTPSRGTGS